MTADIDKLKALAPCPFCGDAAGSVHEHPIATGSYMVMCSNCTAEGPLTNSKDQAVSEWNRRAAPAAGTVEKDPEQLIQGYRGTTMASDSHGPKITIRFDTEVHADVAYRAIHRLIAAHTKAAKEPT